MNFKGSSNNIVTRLYPYGKDGLTIAEVNNGVEYIEDFTHTEQIISEIWCDERFTSAETLLAAAKERLAEAAIPTRSYTLKVIDLAELLPAKYNFLSVKQGDTVTLIDRNRGIRIKHTVEKIRKYPKEKAKNEITLAAAAPSLNDRLKNLKKQ